MKRSLVKAPVTAPTRQTWTPEQARAEELTAALVEDLRQAAETFWTIGERLHEIQDGRLFEALGYATFGDYVAARLDVGLSQAKKMVRIVRNYVMQDATAIGLERAAALIPYAKLVRTDPGILVREKRSLGETTVLEASRRDIDAATAALRAELRKKKGRAPAHRLVAQENKLIVQGLRALLTSEGTRATRITLNARTGEFVIRVPRLDLRKRFIA